MSVEIGHHNRKRAEDLVLLERFKPLHLVLNTPKGRGVFAGEDIASGATIDVSPVLVLDPWENAEHIEKTSLYHYTYNWPVKLPTGKPAKTQAVILGLGSMFNHSTHGQNVGWHRDIERQFVLYRALRDIRQGEELCISYGDHLTFVDTDPAKTEGVEEETAEDILARIEVGFDQ